MIERRTLAAGLVVATMAGTPGWGQNRAAPRPPTIEHDPVTLAVRGQPLSILARVTRGTAPIRSVTLHYAPSRDAAPVKQTMSASGAALYTGTVPETHFRDAARLYYYIEVIDAQEEWAETPWQEVRVQDPRSATQPVVEPSTPGGASRPPAQGGGMSTGKWIAGGALAAGAAVAIFAAADSGGGGGGTSPNGGTDPTDPPPEDPEECTDEDVIGTWLSIDQDAAPGFRILADGSALFFAPPDGEPDTGGWGRVACQVTLIPLLPGSSYRGTATLAPDKASLSLNGSTFVKTP